MLRLQILLVTFLALNAILFARNYINYLEGMIGAFPADNANPIFIAFGQTLICLAIYLALKYRFKRVPYSDQRAVVVLLTQAVLAPLAVDAMWFHHISHVASLQLYGSAEIVHDYLPILAYVVFPVLAIIVFLLINWCEKEAVYSRQHLYIEHTEGRYSKRSRDSQLA